MKVFLAFVSSLVPFLNLEAEEVQIPKKDSFHLSLLVGQSNMAGRGKFEDQDSTPHPRVLKLSKEGKWRARGGKRENQIVRIHLQSC